MTGRTLLHYQIGVKLGAGGMGEVYKAKDTRLGREVAIKVLNAATIGDQDRRQRFIREARAASLLNHPNIVTIHDIGEADGAHFIVMEYMPGKTLDDAIPPKGLETAVALRYGRQIAGALSKAHEAGIVHRDLKPANLMLTPEDTVKVLDFGLAKLAQSSRMSESDATASAQTQVGAILGTVPYMSPEQAEGKPVDARSDIFSFGLVLYEMLSGQRAFAGDSPITTLAAILREEPPRLRDISPELDRIVTRCLRKDPAGRFQTMLDVMHALEDAASTPAAAPEKIPSIAVLPFANMSGDKENEYFSDGLAEEIINALTKLPGLKVTARTSAFAFKGKHEDIRRIGEALNAAHILEGSVRRSGSRVRVTAQLIAIADGCHLWSERYDREMNDIFAIQDEISQAIVGVLKVRLVRPTDQPSHTPNIEAYTAYLEGRYHFGQYTATGITLSLECFERAIALDPDYAAGQAGLAEAYIYMRLFSPAHAPDAVEKALAAAEKAIHLNPGGGDGYLARGSVRGTCEHDWQGAAQDFDRALQLNPDSSRAHFRRAVWYLLPVGRIDEAVAESQRALELDPLSAPGRFVEAWILHVAGRGQAAVEHTRVALEMFPNSMLGSWLSGFILAGQGLFEEAETVLQHALHIDPENIGVRSVLAAVYARQTQVTDDWVRSLERAGEASRILAELEDLSTRQYVTPLAFAMPYTTLGDLEKAYEWFEKAIEVRETWLASVLREPLYAEALAGPRYQDLLRRMNLA
jgi:serine/threonine protein kinase/tetratricopeptide (TPR) repeat protein